MSSFQDKAQHQISQLDKEVCTSSSIESLFNINYLLTTFAGQSSCDHKYTDCGLTSVGSFLNIPPSTTLRSRLLFRKSMSSLDFLLSTFSSSSSILLALSSSTSPDFSCLDIIPSMRSLAQARLMTHRYAHICTILLAWVEIFDLYTNLSIVVDCKMRH